MPPKATCRWLCHGKVRLIRMNPISSLGAFIVFAYGDPQYYSRIGFKTDLAQNFTPPYTLQYPEGWHTMKLNSAVFSEGGKFQCVNSLNDPKLW